MDRSKPKTHIQMGGAHKSHEQNGEGQNEIGCDSDRSQIASESKTKTKTKGKSHVCVCVCVCVFVCMYVCMHVCTFPREKMARIELFDG